MYGIRDREAGNVVESGFKTRKMAQKCVSEYEKMDLADEIYVENFYEIFEYQEEEK